MNKNKFNLRNVVAVAICLIGLMVFSGCAASPRVTPTTNRWVAFEVLPPSIVLNARQGEIILSETLAGGSTLIVYRDFNIPSIDRQFVYTQIRQDFGWQRSRGGYWTRARSSSNRNIVRGNMYVNPHRRMAIYFFPDETWGVYGVRIE